MASIEHQKRMLAHCEATQKKAAERAKAIFELVNLLAQARPFVTDVALHRRITARLEQSHLAFDGEFFVEIEDDNTIVVLAERRKSA